MRKREARQEAIRRVVRRERVRTQRDLVDDLRSAGFACTQATVSRDVAEMGLVKISRDDGERAYAVPARPGQPETSADERLAMILRDLPIKIRPAGLMLVLRATPGSAHAIAAALDRTGWPEVSGSIAGDDTVFVACADRQSLDRLQKRLVRLATPAL